jgi:hypothetical protein
MVSTSVEAGERVDVVGVRCLGVESAVAASGRVEARIEAGHRPAEVDSVVAGAREGTKEEVDRIGLLAEARSTAAGLVVVGLSRVSSEDSTERKGVEVPYPPFSGGAILCQLSFTSSSQATHEDKSFRLVAVGFRGIPTYLMRLEALRMNLGKLFVECRDFTGSTQVVV